MKRSLQVSKDFKRNSIVNLKSMCSDGQQESSMNPLEGIRVLDLTRVLAGPYCTKLLNDAGAEVIKIEYEPGDYYRALPPLIGGESVWFTLVNGGKRGLSLNLKTSKGVEIFRKLVKKSDVIVENLRPGATRKLGIDYDSMREVNPRIIYCSISGYGQTGPEREKAGFDLIAQAEGGLMAVTGERDGDPTRIGAYVADLTAGTYAAFAILLAIIQLNEKNTGQYVDISILDSVVSYTGMFAAFNSVGFPVRRTGNKDLVAAPCGIFKTSNGNVGIVCVGDKLFEDFCKALTLEDLLAEPIFAKAETRGLNLNTLNEKLEKVIQRMSTDSVIGKLEKAGVPCCRVPEHIESISSNQQIRERRMLNTVEHPRMGKILFPGVPYKLSSCTLECDYVAPLLGEHTHEILTALGYSEEQIVQLRKEKVI